MMTVGRIIMSSPLAMRLAVVLLLVVTTSCSQKDAIVGEWKAPGAPVRFEFRRDGTFTTHGNGPKEVTGRYSFDGHHQLVMILTNSAMPVQTSRISIEGDQMTLAGDKDTFSLTFRRVK